MAIYLLLLVVVIDAVISPHDFFVSKPAFGTRAVASEQNDSISFFTFSGALAFDSYQSNIRITTIKSVNPMFFTSTSPNSKSYPSDRIFYGMFKVDSLIFIYAGLGQNDIESDLWAFDSTTELWYDFSNYMVHTKGNRIEGCFDFASCEFTEGNFTNFVMLGGIYDKNSAATDCKWIKIDRISKKISFSQCADFSNCTGMGLSGAQVKYYKGKLYLFSGINTEAKDPKYFTGLCVLDSEKGVWKRINTTNALIGAHRGGSEVYNDTLFYFFGSNYTGTTKTYNSAVFALNLLTPEHGWSVFANATVGCDSFSHILNNNSIFTFGGLCSKDTVLTQFNLLTNKTNSFTFETPLHRIGSSLTRSSNNLFLFGGQSSRFYHSSVWKYETDIKTHKNVSKWSRFEHNALEPTPRKHMASVSQGFFTLVAGGINQNGEFLNDFWILNTNTGTWIQLVPNKDSPSPSGFAYSCAVLKVPYFYLIGGLNSEREPMKEIWKYDLTQDLMTKLKSVSEKFPAKYEFGCQYEKIENKSESVLVYFGKRDGMGSPDCAVGRVEFVANGYLYKELRRVGGMKCRTSAAYHYEDNKLVVVGGKGITGEALSDIWVLRLNNTHVFGESLHKEKLAEPVYGSTYKVFNQNLFLFSGFDANSKTEPESATDLIYKIDLNAILSPALCDLGFESRNGTCQKCPKGTFSRKIGEKCEKCSPNGVLTKHEGSISAVECEINLKYLSNSTKQLIDDYLNHSSTDKNTDFLYHSPDMLTFYVVFGIIMLIFITCFLCIFFAVKNCGMFIIERSMLDDIKEKKEIKVPKTEDLGQPLLSDEKNRDRNIRAMAKSVLHHIHRKKEDFVARKIKKTITKKYTCADTFKGILTGFIVFSLIGILVYLPVDYVNNNTHEKIELVPTVAFRDEFDNLNNSFTIDVVTYPFNYGDCTVSVNHSELVNTETKSHVLYSDEKKQSGAFACHIHLKVNKSDIYDNDFISINFIEKNVYAKNILVWAEAGTAKPGFVSNYFQQLNSTKKNSFDGRVPTVFTFSMVHAYFQEEKYFLQSFNKSGMTIYSDSIPEPGSEIEDSHLQLGSSLSLKIALVGSESSMLTTVYLETGLVDFLTGLAAQLLGVFGFFEGVYIGLLYLLMKLKLAKKDKEIVRLHTLENSEGEEEKEYLDR